jgi:hypothetical protein
LRASLLALFSLLHPHQPQEMGLKIFLFDRQAREGHSCMHQSLSDFIWVFGGTRIRQRQDSVATRVHGESGSGQGRACSLSITRIHHQPAVAAQLQMFSV